MGFSVAAPSCWSVLPSRVRSLRYSTEQFHQHLKTYFHNLAYPLKLRGISVRLLTTGMLIESEIDQSFCFDAPLRFPTI